MTDRSVNPSTPAETVVQWPETVVSKTDKDNDLGPPLVQLLRDLGIKGTLNDENIAGNPTTAVKGTPVSVSIIEAGATAASKGWAALIAALGGATAVWGAVSGFWKNEGAIQGDLVIAAAVVIAACALGIAFIMYGDVRARGQGAAAQYSARASIATAFMHGAVATAKTAPVANNPPLANNPPVKTIEQDNLADMHVEVKATQEQVSGISDATQKILKATGDLSQDLQGAIVALALAQAGDVNVPVVLKNGGVGRAKKLIRTMQGEWRFQLDEQTWIPISEIASFGDEQSQGVQSVEDSN